MIERIGVLNGDVHQRGDHARLANPGAPGTRAPAFVGTRLGRLLRAGRASTRAHTKTLRYWSLLVSGAFVAMSSVGSVVVTARIGADDAVDLVALRLLAYAAWLYALVGLPALLDPRHASLPRVALARLRGVDLGSFSVRAVGIAERLARGLLVAALPGLLAIGFVLPTTTPRAPLAILFAAATAYLLALAATLGIVGALAERISPRSSSSMAFTLLLLPLALSLWINGMPSIPALFIAWFRSLSELGVTT